MAVMVPREKWTDERLDDLNRKVDEGFARLEGDVRGLRKDMNDQVSGLRSEMNARFTAIDARFEKIDGRFEKIDDRFERIDDRFEKINDRFDALNRNLLVVAGTIVAALIGVHAF